MDETTAPVLDPERGRTKAGYLWALGRATGAQRDQAVFALPKAGFATTCHDGQYVFDTDPAVRDATGATVSLADTDGGAGTPWLLMDASRALKPLILQKRRDFKLMAKTALADDHESLNREFLCGANARGAVGARGRP